MYYQTIESTYYIEKYTPTPSPDYWYVAHCKPMKERYAINALRDDLGLNTYQPIVKRGRGSDAAQVPFLPGYIFVQANLQEVRLVDIISAPGVIRLLGFGGDGPQAVPEVVIRRIRDYIDSANASGGIPAHNFKAGDPVTLKSGPMRGLEAIFLESTRSGDRVKVLLQFLGRMNEVQVPVQDLEQVTTRATLPILQGKPEGRRLRYTRGKGRKINRSTYPCLPCDD